MKDYGLRGRNEFVPISQEDYEKVRDERNLINKRLQNEILFDQLLTNVIEWHESMVRFAARMGSSGAANTWKHYRESGLLLRLANVLSACVSFTENSKQHKPGFPRSRSDLTSGSAPSPDRAVSAPGTSFGVRCELDPMGLERRALIIRR